MTTTEAVETIRELAVDDQRPRALVWNSRDSQLLLKTHAASQRHGAGPPSFDPIRDEEKLAMDLRAPTWIARTPNDIVAFLVDRWCERRALAPLRRILEAWPNPGLTDGYALLRDALSRVRSVERDALSPLEEELCHLAENALQRALDR